MDNNLSPEKWLQRLDTIIHKNAQNPKLNNEFLAKEMGTSERDLFRKVKNKSRLSPQKYLRRYRLQLAKTYLKNGDFRTVKETAHAIGYSNVSYFNVQFEKEFGLKPFQILKEEGWR